MRPQTAAERTVSARKPRAPAADAPNPTVPDAVVVPAQRAARVAKEAAICAEAEKQFAQFGFEGTSLEQIAQALSLSRHNLLYYYPSKDALYRTVLDAVLDEWLTRMAGIVAGADPEAALREYIAAKLRYSFERPAGSQVFAREVMAGAPRFRDAIEARVLPALNADVRTFERWARAGLVRKMDFRHLMFTIWAMTQAYADQSAQFAILLGKPGLDEKDFKAAEGVIAGMVIESLVWKK